MKGLEVKILSVAQIFGNYKIQIHPYARLSRKNDSQRAELSSGNGALMQKDDCLEAFYVTNEFADVLMPDVSGTFLGRIGAIELDCKGADSEISESKKSILQITDGVFRIFNTYFLLLGLSSMLDNMSDDNAQKLTMRLVDFENIESSTPFMLAKDDQEILIKVIKAFKRLQVTSSEYNRGHLAIYKKLDELKESAKTSFQLSIINIAKGQIAECLDLPKEQLAPMLDSGLNAIAQVELELSLENAAVHWYEQTLERQNPKRQIDKIYGLILFYVRRIFECKGDDEKSLRAEKYISDSQSWAFANKVRQNLNEIYALCNKIENLTDLKFSSDDILRAHFAGSNLHLKKLCDYANSRDLKSDDFAFNILGKSLLAISYPDNKMHSRIQPKYQRAEAMVLLNQYLPHLLDFMRTFLQLVESAKTDIGLYKFFYALDGREMLGELVSARMKNKLNSVLLDLLTKLEIAKFYSDEIAHNITAKMYGHFDSWSMFSESVNKFHISDFLKAHDLDKYPSATWPLQNHKIVQNPYMYLNRFWLYGDTQYKRIQNDVLHRMINNWWVGFKDTPEFITNLVFYKHNNAQKKFLYLVYELHREAYGFKDSIENLKSFMQNSRINLEKDGWGAPRNAIEFYTENGVHTRFESAKNSTTSPAVFMQSVFVGNFDGDLNARDDKAEEELLKRMGYERTTERFDYGVHIYGVQHSYGSYFAQFKGLGELDFDKLDSQKQEKYKDLLLPSEFSESSFCKESLMKRNENFKNWLKAYLIDIVSDKK